MEKHGYGSIVGHEDEIRQLKRAVRYDRISHAYLLTGESGSGKHMLADAFAMSLVCERHSEEPCMSCAACKKAMDRNHPDIIYVTHEKPNNISVDEIRSQVVNTVDIRPYEGGRKIYIIADAEKMNPQAQNALLKTIEEPPSYATLMLLTNSPEVLLPTIRSRCIHLPVKPVRDELVEQYLMEELQLPDYEARVLTAFAQGNIGRARAAATEESFAEIRNTSLDLIRHLPDMDTAAISDSIKKWKESKDRIYDYLDMMLIYFRDVLLYKASQRADAMIFSGNISQIRSQAGGSSYEGLEKVLQALDQCRVRLQSNVNFELSMELLCFTIKENCKNA